MSACFLICLCGDNLLVQSAAREQADLNCQLKDSVEVREILCSLDFCSTFDQAKVDTL